MIKLINVFLMSALVRCVVSLTPRLLYARGTYPQCPLERRLGGLHYWSGWHGEQKYLASTVVDPRPFDSLASIQLLYRLRYLSSPKKYIRIINNNT
jgi:hypothetical protein